MRKTRNAGLNTYPTFNPDTKTNWSAKEIYSDTTSTYAHGTEDYGGDADDDIDENCICIFFLPLHQLSKI